MINLHWWILRRRRKLRTRRAENSIGSNEIKSVSNAPVFQRRTQGNSHYSIVIKTFHELIKFYCSLILSRRGLPGSVCQLGGISFPGAHPKEIFSKVNFDSHTHSGMLPESCLNNNLSLECAPEKHLRVGALGFEIATVQSTAKNIKFFWKKTKNPSTTPQFDGKINWEKQ